VRIAPARWSTLLLLTAIGLAPGSAVAADPDGAALYQENCAKCHGPDGKAETPVARAMKAPSLVQSQVARGDVSALGTRIGEVDKHKPLTAKLSPAEIAAIARAVHDMAAAAKP
jgi:mono/diheme cytochrome c family protein